MKPEEKLSKALSRALAQGLNQLGVNISRDIQTKLLDYLNLLQTWNAVHNLTSIRDPFEMIKFHLLDSFTLLPFLREKGRLLDVGTGAGLPGIPLSLVLPKMEFVLIDSSHKKTDFIQHCILKLALKNVTVVCARVEDYASKQDFDFVVSRALGSLALFADLAGAHCNPGGTLIAMKGALSKKELEALDKRYTIESIQRVEVPGVTQERNLVIMSLKSREGISC